MGFFLGYALSLFGRPQDKLSHVLVSEPFESSSGFYYPSPVSRVLELPGGRLVDCANAQVTLADLPFVSLRHGLPQALLTGRASYNQTVEAARSALAVPELALDLEARRIKAGGKHFSLPPAELALLSVRTRTAQRIRQGRAARRATVAGAVQRSPGPRMEEPLSARDALDRRPARRA